MSPSEKFLYPDYGIITQGFGQNFNPSYAAQGLHGHPAFDVVVGYGTDVLSPFNGYVYKVLKPNASYDFTAVFMIVDNGYELFEFMIGHMSEIIVNAGDHVTRGQLLGKEGNYGLTYVGQTEITAQMKRNGDKRASHRHYQKRPIEEKTPTAPDFLTDINGSVYIHNTYYHICDYNNGFNGCVDPLIGPLTKNLFIGIAGYEVDMLQKYLMSKSFLNIDKPTAYFGSKTLSAVAAFQKFYSIAPAVGFVGLLTRGIINSKIELDIYGKN